MVNDRGGHDRCREKVLLMADDNLFDTVIRGGYCIGCGACAAVSDRITIRLNSLGMFEAAAESGMSGCDAAPLAAVCPFSATAEDETVIARRLFAAGPTAAEGDAAAWHKEIGFHRRTYVGHVAEGGFRAEGSSGGMASWIVLELMNRGEIDGVIHVRPGGAPAEDNSLLFSFAVSRTPEEVRRGARSRYYPVTLAGVLAEIRKTPESRFALVGIPCFVKAARLLAEQDPFFARAIRFHIGLVCGHLKSSAYAECLGWLAGVAPDDLEDVEFRRKTPGQPANRYVFTARSKSTNAEVRLPTTRVAAGDWGLGFFKYKACDACDDVFAETADIAIGDAWLPEYVDDSRGTNIVIVRHAGLVTLVENAIASARLALEPLAPERVAESQRAGLRHRREGLACRLHDARARGEWSPPKRVAPTPPGRRPRRAAVYRLREQVARESHAAFAKAKAGSDLAIFNEQMAPLVAAYRARTRSPVLLRAFWLARRIVLAVIDRLSR